MLTRSIGQAVKTPPSHGGNRGSIPLSTVQLSLNTRQHGRLVKRLRHRPLTAETGVRFPYRLLSSGKALEAGLFLLCRKLCPLAKNSAAKSEISYPKIKPPAYLYAHLILLSRINMREVLSLGYLPHKQITGIEPASPAWEASVLPMNYICITKDIITQF